MMYVGAEIIISGGVGKTEKILWILLIPENSQLVSCWIIPAYHILWPFPMAPVRETLSGISASSDHSWICWVKWLIEGECFSVH